MRRLSKTCFVRGIAVVVATVGWLAFAQTAGWAMAADCGLAPTGEHFLGVRYKAYLAEDELSESDWVLLFGESRFTREGEIQSHLVDLMIKGSWSIDYPDPSCGRGWFPGCTATYDEFAVEFGLSDYEDDLRQDNDIGATTNNPALLPRMFSNIDSVDPEAADKIIASYQTSHGGSLDGREIEVSLVRQDLVTLTAATNAFMDPDLPDPHLCTPCAQEQIQYWRWRATLAVPSLGVEASVDFYVNANEGEMINGDLYPDCLNFMWENPGRPSIESDRFRVILYDIEVKRASGDWHRANRFLVDYRTPDVPLDEFGNPSAGYRRVMYSGRPAIEASFGYGYDDYVADGNPYDRDSSQDTMGVLDLSIDPAPDSAAVFRVANGSVFADRTFHASSFQVGAADVAEWICVSGSVSPGEVVEQDPRRPGSYRLTTAPCSSLVAGVVSTEPGVVLGASPFAGGQVLLALSGIIPVKVTNEGGPIRPGDLLVSSSTSGCAMRWAGLEPCPCAFVGKALEPMTADVGLILVLLTAH